MNPVLVWWHPVLVPVLRVDVEPVPLHVVLLLRGQPGLNPLGLDSGLGPLARHLLQRALACSGLSSYLGGRCCLACSCTARHCLARCRRLRRLGELPALLGQRGLLQPSTGLHDSPGLERGSGLAWHTFRMQPVAQVVQCVPGLRVGIDPSHLVAAYRVRVWPILAPGSPRGCAAGLVRGLASGAACCPGGSSSLSALAHLSVRPDNLFLALAEAAVKQFTRVVRGKEEVVRPHGEMRQGAQAGTTSSLPRTTRVNCLTATSARAISSSCSRVNSS